MNVPDFPHWTAAGLNLAAILVTVLIMASDRDIIVFLTGLLWVILNSVFLMFNISHMFSRTSEKTQEVDDKL